MVNCQKNGKWEGGLGSVSSVIRADYLSSLGAEWVEGSIPRAQADPTLGTRAWCVARALPAR